MKIVLFANPYPEEQNLMYPLFQSQDEIIGTQWLIPNFHVKLKNFQERDFIVNNDVASSGYKKYYSSSAIADADVLLVDVRLSDVFLQNGQHFTQEERLLVLHEQVTTVLNQVPVDIDILINTWSREKDGRGEDRKFSAASAALVRPAIIKQEFGLFQPQELLKGNNICDFTLKNPGQVKNCLNHEKLGKQQYCPSLVESFLANQNNDDLKELLKQLDYLPQNNEIIADLFSCNSLQRCFELESVQLASAKLLLSHVVVMNKTQRRADILMKILPHILLDKDPFVQFSNFFNSFQDRYNLESEQMSLCFTWHHKKDSLPKFQQSEHQIRKFETSKMALLEIHTNLTERIGEEIIQ